jgi:hypothetical protein
VKGRGQRALGWAHWNESNAIQKKGEIEECPDPFPTSPQKECPVTQSKKPHYPIAKESPFYTLKRNPLGSQVSLRKMMKQADKDLCKYPKYQSPSETPYVINYC